MLTPRILYLLGAALTLGCTPRKAPEAGATEPVQARRDPSVLRRDELDPMQLSELSAYQAVQQLRPRFLAPLGPTAMVAGNGGGLLVYVDATRIGGADALKEIRMTEVSEIRYLAPSEATLRFGTGHENGVILVRRRR